jgi:hypothetical protein
MKRNLRIGALAILLIALGWWAACGANRGWTRTSVPVRTLDAVTGLEGIEYRKRFVPGVDFLALAAAAAVALAGLSLLFRRPAPAENQAKS